MRTSNLWGLCLPTILLLLAAAATPLGYGAGCTITNVLGTVSSGNTSNTNVFDTTHYIGSLIIDYDFIIAPDRITIYYEDGLIYDTGLISGQGTFQVDYGPGISTDVVIIMNEGDTSSESSFWNYVPTVVMDMCGGPEIPLVNNSFEEPVLSDGTYSSALPGWIAMGGGNEAGTMNPNNALFSSTTDGGSGDSPIDGLNAAFVNYNNKLIYDDSSVVVQPNVTYTLRLLAGQRITGAPFGTGSSVSLWAGTELLAEKFPQPPLDSFIPVSLTYTSPPSGTVIGKPLRIEFKCVEVAGQAWFDDLHLFAKSGSPPFCSPHKASATAQLVNGVFVGGTINDPGCGYTNAPTVLIQGGGGVAATAAAVIRDGVVAEIRVTNGGCCYTSVPKIVIGSPPFVPTLEIRVSRVMVKQNVVLGRRYVLESSEDFDSWTPTGPPFTAQSELIENEFVVEDTGQFFRIFEVP